MIAAGFCTGCKQQATTQEQEQVIGGRLLLSSKCGCHGLWVLQGHSAKKDNNHPYVNITLQCLQCPLTSIILLITTLRWVLMLSSPVYRGNWGSQRQNDMHKATLGSGKGGTLATGILTQRWPFFFFSSPRKLSGWVWTWDGSWRARGIEEATEAFQAVLPTRDAMKKDRELDQVTTGIPPSGENVLIL